MALEEVSERPADSMQMVTHWGFALQDLSQGGSLPSWFESPRGPADMSRPITLQTDSSLTAVVR